MGIDARFQSNECHYYEPQEPASSGLAIKSVFPSRGVLAGGSKLHIYGDNFKDGTVAVTVGGKVCGGAKVVSNKPILECTLPVGTLGTKDVVVTIGSASDTFSGYRNIAGKP